MTLLFSVTFPGAHPDGIRQAVQAAADVSGTPVVYSGPRWLSRHEDPGAALPEAETFLAADADPDSETWNFTAAGLTAFDLALEALYEAAHDTMVFRFGPDGEAPARAEVLSIEELARLLRENRIARGTAYHVHRR